MHTPIGEDRTELRLPLIVNTAFWDRLADGRIAWSALDKDRVFIHSPAGRLERIVSHAAWRIQSMSDADRVALVGVYRKARNQPTGPLPSNVDVPERLPTITGLRASPDGGFWVQRMGPADAIPPSVLNNSANTGWLGGPLWDVFDSAGRSLGTVRLPDRFRITRLTTNGAVGVQKDDLDVERVVRLTVRHRPRD
ncbi:MAG: hypothetical protein ACE5HT_16300 [Gemmatimonadales bacterium]